LFLLKNGAIVVYKYGERFNAPGASRSRRTHRLALTAQKHWLDV
jgi:hypothetical protein